MSAVQQQATEEYTDRWKPNEYADAADAKKILSFLFAQLRPQLDDVLARRLSLEPKELTKHPFAKIVGWITKIVAVHRKDPTMRAWLLNQTNTFDDGVATVCLTMVREFE